MNELNAEAEAWIANCDYIPDKDDLREAMRWAYADAARVCGTVATAVKPNDYGAAYLGYAANHCAEAILARSGAG